MDMVIELTDEEAMNLRGLLDAAVRAQGMRVVEFAMLIDAKIVEAAQPKPTVKGEGIVPGGNGRHRLPL
jgi:hypothetical protein